MANILGAIFGGIGAIVGLIALYYAHNAKSDANAGKGLAVEANDLARESNTIATDAKQLAAEANDISRRGEARDTERHDVHWEGDWDQPGVYILTKLGADEACYVKATVTYDDERITKTADTITNEGHQLVFKFHTAAADFQREVAEHTRRKRQDDAYRIAGGSWGMHPHRVEERVEWTTPQGNPKLHQDEVRLSTFDHWYPGD